MLRLLLGTAACAAVLSGVFWFRHPDRVAVQPWVQDENASMDDAVQLEEALGRSRGQDRHTQGPPVVVVVLDGWNADDAPLSSLADFETSTLRACAPDSLSAQACLLTGLPPHAHGVFRQRGKQNGLRALIRTLPQELQAASWRTHAVVGERAVRPSRTGLKRGFDVFLGDDLIRGDEALPYIPADRLVPLALSLLDSDGPRQFLYLHLADGRLPWIPRRPFLAEGPLEGYFLPAGGTRVRALGFKEQKGRLSRHEAVDQAALATWETARRSEWQYIDAQLALFLEGLPPEAQVVVVGTAGLEFPGQLEVGGALVEQTVRVPLAWRGIALGDLSRQDELAHALAAQLQVEGLLHPAVEDSGVVELHAGDSLNLFIDEIWRVDPKGRAEGGPEVQARADAWLAGVDQDLEELR